MARRHLPWFASAVLLAALLAWLWAAVQPMLRVGVGLGAKLACSARYVSGFDTARIEDDIAVYSPLTRAIRYRWLPEGGVEASLPGAGATAHYRPGLGCTLDYGEPAVLDALEVPVVPAASGESWPRGSAVPPPRPALQRLLEAILAQDNAAGLDTRALLVVHDGAVVAEAYAEGIGPRTPLLGWSMGKSVLAIVLGRLERLRRLSVDERGLFLAWRADGRADISVENLLQMSSGLRFDEAYEPGRDATRMLFESPAAAALPLAAPLQHPPGKHFSYSSGTTNLLARLALERAGGSPQAQIDFFRRELAQPLGLRDTTLEPDADGVFVASSFVYASARDWARFGQLLVAGGTSGDRRLLDADWVARAVRPNGSDNDRRYGYQLWLNAGGEPRWPSLPRDAYAMQGNRRQVVMMLPAQRSVIVRLGWSPGDYPVDANFARILAAVTGPAGAQR